MKNNYSFIMTGIFFLIIDIIYHKELNFSFPFTLFFVASSLSIIMFNVMRIVEDFKKEIIKALKK